MDCPECRTAMATPDADDAALRIWTCPKCNLHVCEAWGLPADQPWERATVESDGIEWHVKPEPRTTTVVVHKQTPREFAPLNPPKDDEG